ncbi:hypothetical protein CCUS01_00721 [Colletotrichum cuscutae]|uniref:Uncharacterized protein n=1 Tax=Colletotrichum cuscutae TaxID=1209917 RepID=A0AAI9VBF3_9PEZI|nr:hypothetical protein CCUS01_00721 [Colletotrichum cuscutae]
MAGYSLGSLNKIAGIRNAAICPGVVDVSFNLPQIRNPAADPNLPRLLQLRAVDEVAKFAISAICDSKYGDGNVIEVFCGGTKEDHKVCVRDVPLENLCTLKQDEFEQKSRSGHGNNPLPQDDTPLNLLGQGVTILQYFGRGSVSCIWSVVKIDTCGFT